MKPLLFAALGAALLLGAGCAERGLSTAAAPAPLAPTPSPQPDPDQCQAAALQSFVGKPLASLPPVPEGATRREACETCIMTMDLRNDRQTVVYDAQTSLIKSIQCV